MESNRINKQNKQPYGRANDQASKSDGNKEQDDSIRRATYGRHQSVESNPHWISDSSSNKNLLKTAGYNVIKQEIAFTDEEIID